MQTGYRQTRVDHEGSYKLPGISPGHWHLNASLPGGGKHATGDIEIEQGMRQARLDLKFGSGIKLSGTVLRAGEPQAGLSVYIEGKEVDSYATSTTDFAGRFEADGLERGVHAIVVSNDTGALRYLQQIDLQQDEVIVIRIPETHIRGRVTDSSDGTPIAGASISISSSSDERWSPSNTVSATDGAFELRNIGDGQWKVDAKKDGYASATQNVQLQPDQDVDNLDFSLQPTEGITLVVHLPGGGIPNRITYAALDSAGSPIGGIANIATGEDGHVKLTSLPPGKWELLLKAISSATASVLVSSPQQGPIEITLPQLCSLHVKVPELATGKIVGKAVFTNAEGKIYRDPNPYSQLVTQEREFYSGDIQMYLPPGTWTVRASAPDGRSWSGTTTISPTTPGELTLSN